MASLDTEKTSDFNAFCFFQARNIIILLKKKKKKTIKTTNTSWQIFDQIKKYAL